MKKIMMGLIITLSLWGADTDRVKVFLDLQTGIESYQYEEKSVMSISGPMYRMDANLGLLIDFFRIQLEGYYSRDINQNTYKGALMSYNSTTQKTEKTPYATHSKDWYAGGNLKLGFSFLPKQIEAQSFAYIGIGYRFLRNNVIDKPGIRAAYQRDQSYLYLPVGVDADIPITDYFSLVAMMEYRFFLQGTNTSGFSRLGYDSDLVFTQKEGHGGRATVAARFQSPRGLKIQIGLYYDYWFIEDSNTQPLYKNGVSNLIFIEPKNNTKAVGLMAGIIF